VTTEGGLDVVGNREAVARAVKQLQDAGIVVSLFLDPDPRQIDAAAELRAEAVQLHTGQYALTKAQARAHELQRLLESVRHIQ